VKHEVKARQYFEVGLERIQQLFFGLHIYQRVVDILKPTSEHEFAQSTLHDVMWRESS
jgi:hypothetical protein